MEGTYALGSQMGRMRRLWLRFLGYSFAVFLIYSAYGSLLSLQSSMNIEDGNGTKTVAILYGVAVVSSLVFLPLLLRYVGPRKCVIASGVSYMFQTSANYFPVAEILIPAAIIVGIGDAILWTCMPIYIAHFAKEYQILRETGVDCIAKFSGYFFAIFQSAKIVGNVVSYAVLQSFCNNNDCVGNTNISLVKNVSICGANDCQDPNEIQNSIDNYVPNQVATYILLGVMLCMQLIGTILFGAFLPHVEVSSKAPHISHNKKQTRFKVRHHLKVVPSALNDTLHQIVRVNQLLLLPGIFYAGLDYGFLTSEFTRAYTSCIFGVSWVPIHIIAYGVSATIVSSVGGKLSDYIPISALIAFAVLVDSGTYVYYLLWEPHAATHWAVLPAYIFSGGMQGIWISQSQALQSTLFPQDMDVGSSIWNFWYMLGISFHFAISTFICVNAKIILQLTILGVAAFAYVVLEVLRIRKKPMTDVVT